MPAPSPLPHFSETTSIKVSVRAEWPDLVERDKRLYGHFRDSTTNFAKSDDFVWRISHDLVFNK